MTTSIEVIGKSLDEALFNALRQLDRRPDEIRYEVLSSEAGQMRLLVTLREEGFQPPPPPLPPTPAEPVMEPVEEGPVTSGRLAEAARDMLAGLLESMDVRGQVVIREHGVDSDEVLSVTLDVLGDDLGVLIGRRGETLRALQFITRLMVGKSLQTWARVNVDVEHYRTRRADTLRNLAERMAERVQTTGESVTLEAMPPDERRIVHLALRDNPYIATKSYGEEGDRKVVLSPVVQPD